MCASYVLVQPALPSGGSSDGAGNGGFYRWEYHCKLLLDSDEILQRIVSKEALLLGPQQQVLFQVAPQNDLTEWQQVHEEQMRLQQQLQQQQLGMGMGSPSNSSSNKNGGSTVLSPSGASGGARGGGVSSPSSTSPAASGRAGLTVTLRSPLGATARATPVRG